MKSLKRRIEELEASAGVASIGQMFEIKRPGFRTLLVTEAELSGMPPWCVALAEPVDVDVDTRREIERRIKQGISATMKEARERHRAERLNLAGSKQV